MQCGVIIGEKRRRKGCRKRANIRTRRRRRRKGCRKRANIRTRRRRRRKGCRS